MDMPPVHWIFILYVILTIPHRALANDLTRLLRQTRSCTDAESCGALTSAACSFPAVISDCPLLCEDPSCLTSSVAAGCADAASCTALTSASCAFPAIAADCPVLCDACPKTATDCQSGFELVDVQCLKFSKKSKTWTDAKTACENVNATLVIPTDFDALVDYVLTHNLFYNQYWVGASNQVTGNYQWLDGSDVEDSVWYSGYKEPQFNNFGNDSCVKLHLQAHTSGLIAAHDTKCSGYHHLHYICQED